MIVYVDSSALLKRVFDETESEELETTLARHTEAGHALIVSTFAWVEVERAVRTALAGDQAHDHNAGDIAAAALAGIAESPIGADVISLGHRLTPATLRSLDAIHLATAVLVDADAFVAYDHRLLAAARHNDFAVESPGRASDES